jgi:hypothetical protein
MVRNYPSRRYGLHTDAADHVSRAKIDYGRRSVEAARNRTELCLATDTISSAHPGRLVDHHLGHPLLPLGRGAALGGS